MTKPEMSKLEQLAWIVALETPLKPKFEGQRSSYVEWTIINAIRAELEHQGYDWRASHKHAQKIIKERERARKELANAPQR